MKFFIDRQEKYCLLALLEEKLNSLNATQFKTELVTLHAEGVRNMILDLSKVNFVDSSGLSSLLVGNRVCKQANGTFVIAGANDNVMKLIKISQLDSILQIVPTPSEAIDLVLMDEVEREINDESND
jgi:anti-anti-sigma factor